MYGWSAKNITRKNIDEVLAFCSEYEVQCINLVQHLLQEKKRLEDKIFPLMAKKIPLAKVFYFDGRIMAVACINCHHFFLYCVAMQTKKILCDAHRKALKQRDELWPFMLKAFPMLKIYALMGEAELQLKLKEFLFYKRKIKPTHVMHYLLMIFDSKCYEEKRESPVYSSKLQQKITATSHLLKLGATSNALLTRQATIADASSLLPLQLEYEKEEVCIDKKTFPPYVSMMNLQKILKEEITYMTTLNGVPIAKANTNAKGINCQQLGGIYTLTQYRKQGVGTLTVSALISHICKIEKKKVALFVNVKNMPAIAMYKKLGFMEAGRFMISYFG